MRAVRAKHKSKVPGEKIKLSFLAIRDDWSIVSRDWLFTPTHAPKGTVRKDRKTANGA